MKILVTGHKGYIGSKLYKRCLEYGYKAIGIDIKEGNNILDILNEKFFLNFKPEIIFHLAANPRIQQSVETPSLVAKTNTLGTSVMLEYAKKVEAKRFIFSSSSAIYGNGNGPVNPYGLQKQQSELECKYYSLNSNVDTVCLRYFNVYSQDQKPSDVYPTVISAWMQAIRQGRELVVYGEGQHRRDYVHVDDIVDCNLFAANYYGNFHGGYFDVGTGKNYDLNFIKNYILENAPTIKFKHLPARPTDALSTLANTNSLNNMGWNAKINFKEALEKCFSRENLK